jgi:beta-lactamase class A
MESRSYSLAELCRLMMVVSDNTASNACLRQVGMGRLNEFFDGRGYEARVRRYFMSPVVAGKDNEMTAESAALMLDDLYAGRGLSDELRDFAVGCLRRQQFREKIPLMLPPELLVGHKTGELEGVRHDAAVVEAKAPYIVVIFTADGEAPWLVDAAMAACSLEVFHLHPSLLRGVSR